MKQLPPRNEEPRKPRNWHAVNAHQRKAGPMKDRRKAASREACRGWKRGDSGE